MLPQLGSPSGKQKLRVCIFLRLRKLQNRDCCILGQFSTCWALGHLPRGRRRRKRRSLPPDWGSSKCKMEPNLRVPVWLLCGVGVGNTHPLNFFIFFFLREQQFGAWREVKIRLVYSFAWSFCLTYIQYECWGGSLLWTWNSGSFTLNLNPQFYP